MARSSKWMLVIFATVSAFALGILFQTEMGQKPVYSDLDSVGHWHHDGTNVFLGPEMNRVGIGTANPAATLHVAGTMVVDNNQNLQFRDTGGTPRTVFSYSTSDDVIFTNTKNAPLQLRTQNQPRVTILGDGKVGIGTTTPQQQLHLSGSMLLGNSQNLQFLDSGGSPTTVFSYSASNTAILTNPKNAPLELRTLNQPRLTILGDGRVGIGTTSPTERLQVEGNVKLNGNITSDGEICIGSGC